jgi:hypothetical protein
LSFLANWPSKIDLAVTVLPGDPRQQGIEREDALRGFKRLSLPHV